MTNQTNIRPVLIVDDDHRAVSILHTYCQHRPDMEVVLATQSGEDAAAFIADHDVDIALIDIDLRTMSGFELISTLDGRSQAIVCTAADNQGEEALAAGARDYLVKPIREERFNQVIDRAMDQLKLIDNQQVPTRYNEVIALPDAYQKYTTRLITVSDIIYARADEKETWLFLKKGGVAKVTALLGHLERNLDPKRFVRIQKGYLVKIQALGDYIQEDTRHWLHLHQKYTWDWDNGEPRQGILPLGGPKYRERLARQLRLRD